MPTGEGQAPGTLAVDLTVLAPSDEDRRPRPNPSRGRLSPPVSWSRPWNPLLTGWASRPSRMHAYAWIALHGRWFEHDLVTERKPEPDGVVFIDEPWVVFTGAVVTRYANLTDALDAIDCGDHERFVEAFVGKGSRTDLLSRAYQGGLPGLGRRR
jgi:hypothetical protein